MSTPAALAICFLSTHLGRMFMPWRYLFSEIYEEQLGQILFFSDHPSYFKASPCIGKKCPTSDCTCVESNHISPNLPLSPPNLPLLLTYLPEATPRN